MVAKKEKQRAGDGGLSRRVAILGTVGVPASYGGFESLADNLCIYFRKYHPQVHLSVYCEGGGGPETYEDAELRYIKIPANGVFSVLYDFLALLDSARKKDDVILLLGVSGAAILPIVKLMTNAVVITNVDGIEWKRDKWGLLAKAFLRISELMAVKFSDKVIADNIGISNYLSSQYSAKAFTVAYGGDHALSTSRTEHESRYPPKYCLALCRIEPENNVDLILKCFAVDAEINLVFIGNWKASAYSRGMFDLYSHYPNIFLEDAIYDVGKLHGIRSDASSYIHGHSAGGTNPSLVEMMHFGLPIFAYDCSFNRYTTDEEAIFFKSAEDLRNAIKRCDAHSSCNIGTKLKALANERYTWLKVGEAYRDLLLG